jgi:FtsZ-interacting cell division protein ZipA
MLLQTPNIDAPANTILQQWGAPGAIIILLIIGILIFGRWFSKREFDRVEYDKILRKSQDDKFNELQKKYEDQIGTIAVTNEKLVDMATELKDVVINNTEQLKENQKFSQEMIISLREFSNYLISLKVK